MEMTAVTLDMLNTLVAFTGKKPLRETVTPHKVALLVMIKEYCTIISKHDMNEFSNKQTRNIALNTLKFIQAPDVSLKEMSACIQQTTTPKFYQLFCSKLRELYEESVAGFMEHIQSVEILMVDPNLPIPVVHKSSVIGLFLRRMLLAFDKMSFSQVTKLYRNFKSYYEANYTEKSMDSSSFEMLKVGGHKTIDDHSDDENEVEKKNYLSYKQAEFFISQQAALIQTNEKEAMSPVQLQNRIQEILTAHPHLAEAHFLSYLNSLRVKEYCGSVRHLYHCFDRSAITNHDNKSCPDDVGRSFRYAALNLAALHCRFGHHEEALAALREAITMAQETNDNICLQHALSWLYRLARDGRETLLERSIMKTGDLNLSYLTSLGVQSFAQHKASLSMPPSQIFEFMMKSDILNCQYSMLELMANSYAQKAALWHVHGKSCMANLSSQLLLHLNTSDPTRKGLYHSGEGICLALCNVATCLAQRGHIKSARDVINYTKERFPSHSQQSHLWMLVENLIDFDQSIRQGNWQEAEKIVQNVAVIKSSESSLRLAQMYLYRGDFTNASKLLKLLDEEYQKEDSAEYQAKVLILQSELHVLSGNYAAAIAPLFKGLILSKQHYLDYMSSLFTLHIANVQLLLGLPTQAITLLNQVMVGVLSNGSLFDRARAYFLYAKCIMAKASKSDKETRKEAWFSAITMISKAIEDFEKVEAHDRVKDAIYIQACIYNELGFIEDRNRCSLKFRELNQQYESSFQPRIQLL